MSGTVKYGLTVPRARRKEGKPLTCIVGMYCEGGHSAVIVSDSREMLRTDFATVRKIFGIGDHFVFAASGLSGMSLQLRRNVLNRVAQIGPLDHAQTIQLIENEMWEIWARYKSPYVPNQSRFVQDEGLVDAIVGGFLGREPQLYVLHENGWAEPIEGRFRATGDGERYANQILRNLYRDDLTVERAIMVGIHVIVQIARLDAVVDDNAQVAVLKDEKIDLRNQVDGEFRIEGSDSPLYEKKRMLNGIERDRTTVFEMLLGGDPLKTALTETLKQYREKKGIEEK